MRYDIKFKKTYPDSGKEYWHKIGTAIPNQNGNGYSCHIHSIPINWDGNFHLFPSKDYEGDKK